MLVLFIGWAQPGLASAADLWRFTGPGGGYVRALASDPTGVLYAGTEDGGVFQSQDGGHSWGAKNTGLSRALVRALVIDRDDAAILYVGTRGSGVFKSEDAGTHWLPANTGLSSVEINALASDPARPRVLYAGSADAGLFVSRDAGANWHHVDLGTPDLEINGLAVDPASSTTVYAATQGGGVFKTEDAGQHWQALAASPRYVNALAIDPSAPGTIYGAGFGVARSNDGGGTWEEINDGLSLNGFTPQVISLLIDADDSATLWAGTFAEGVFRSGDGGRTWSKRSSASPDATYPYVTAYAFARDAAGSDTLYVGGYGVLVSEDEGAIWKTTGLPGAAPATALAIERVQPDVLYLATYGQGLFKTVDGAAHWSRAGAGLAANVYDVDIDGGMPAMLYAGTNEGLFKSSDAGASWRPTQLAGDTHAIVIAATDPPTILAASYDPDRGYDVFTSRDAGATWNPSGIVVGYVSGLAVDPKNSLTVYGSGIPYAHSFASGGVLKSIDLAEHWTLTGLRSFDAVSPLAVDPMSSLSVFAGYRAGLLVSRDGGATWRAANNGLPDGSVSQVLFDPIDPRLMYAVGGGVFSSHDAAASWTPLGSGLGEDAVALAIDPVIGTTLYAGNAHGVFTLSRTDLDPLRSPPPTATATPTPDPRCAPDQISIAPPVAAPEAEVLLAGQCYFLHSGRHADVYFDTTRVGEVQGDTPGNYRLQFQVPADALPGPHVIRVEGAQSTTLQVAPSPVVASPTPTYGAVCPTDNLTVVPDGGRPGTRIVVSGQCYYIHSGASGSIYFDDTVLGTVRGDTPGDYAATFVVPEDATLGLHTVRLRSLGGGSDYQSATFLVEEADAPGPTPTLTVTQTTTIAIPSATATGTVTASATAELDRGSDGGGCCVRPAATSRFGGLVLLFAPAIIVGWRARTGGRRR